MTTQLRADTQDQPAGHTPISMRCPVCGKQATLDPLGQGDFFIRPADAFVGHRRCPANDCHTHIFIAFRVPAGAPEPEILAAYPPEVLDFDATNIPKDVTEAMQEAIQCHAIQCYIAAAIMVRKTLEELCADQKVTGKNLKERIAALGTKIVLPKEMLEGLDELRLLGNDAAHIESKEFNEIGQEEVEIGIEFAKEVLKATYQQGELVKRLKALKSSQT